MKKLCESCEGAEIQWYLKDAYSRKVVYKLCSNCLVRMTNLALTPEHYRNLLKNGHKATEFYLHGDFYDDDGTATQPRWG